MKLSFSDQVEVSFSIVKCTSWSQETHISSPKTAFRYTFSCNFLCNNKGRKISKAISMFPSRFSTLQKLPKKVLFKLLKTICNTTQNGSESDLLTVLSLFYLNLAQFLDQLTILEKSTLIFSLDSWIWIMITKGGHSFPAWLPPKLNYDKSMAHSQDVNGVSLQVRLTKRFIINQLNQAGNEWSPLLKDIEFINSIIHVMYHCPFFSDSDSNLDNYFALSI